MKITKTMYTETAHRLQSHAGRCKNIHGHSYKFEVTLETDQLQLNCMVEDFSDLKKKMNSVIDNFDHSIVLEENDPMLPIIAQYGQRLLVWPEAPTAESMAYHTARKLEPLYPNCKITVRVWETTTRWAEYSC